MPFGLIDAPTIFQHLINDICLEFLDNFVVCYLDDIQKTRRIMKNMSRWYYKITWYRTLCQVGEGCTPPISRRILGLYNLWKKPFYRPKENLDHYGMEKAKVSLRCPIFPWFCKLLSTFYLRLFKDCCSVDVTYLQGQAWMEFGSKPTFSGPQDCLYNSTIFIPSRFLEAILHWKWFWLCP
jgi:hypothetical protein